MLMIRVKRDVHGCMENWKQCQRRGLGGEATATMESYEVSLEIRTDEDLLQ